jgi:AAA+ ATPase superfamily predicted ATPase
MLSAVIMFVGRVQELQILHREYDRSRPSLLVVLGRRRVGKSMLLLKSVEGRQHIYYQASKLTDLDNQTLFKQVIKNMFSRRCGSAHRRLLKNNSFCVQDAEGVVARYRCLEITWRYGVGTATRLPGTICA